MDRLDITVNTEPFEMPSLKMTAFLNEKRGVPAVLILPGGAYMGLAPMEGSPVAKAFAGMGYSAFVLRYSTLYGGFDPHGEPDARAFFPGPMLETALAMRYLRAHADELGIDAHRLFLCGFSAGGHLAGCCCAALESELAPALGVGAESIRPDGLLLCYAVTGLLPHDARGGVNYMNLAVFGGKIPSEADIARRSPAVNVTAAFPPTFLWCTAEDGSVGAENSIRMALALAENGVPYELHVFRRGPHAMALAESMAAGEWPRLADRFLREL